VGAGAWTTLKFDLPADPVTAFTGNGILESSTGKGVLEHLALVAAGGTGAYNVYLDNFLQVQNPSLTYSLEPGAPAGAAIDPETGVFTWTPAPGQGPATYNITVRVTDGGLPGLSDTETFAVTVSAAPAITSQPQGQTVFPDANVTFAVGATGTAPLLYQWRFNGEEIPGATGSAYTRNAVQSSDAGDYSVVVSNALGAVVSSNATLAISVLDSPPSITQQPADRTVNQNAAATFGVVVLGTVPLTYQWQFNGVEIPDATASSYTRASAQGGHAGGYRVVVTNGFGGVTSEVANLTVILAPTIATQPQGQSVNQGADVSLTVAANGTPPLFYQWRKGGTNLNGATGTSYALNNVQAAGAGTYSVVVTNAAGSATSGNAVLIVYIPPAISTQPSGQTVAAGAGATFSVAASGVPAPSYQWRRNGVDIGGATASSYTRSNVQSADVGLYSVVLSNLAGTVTSSEAALSLTAAVIFKDDFESGTLTNWTTAASPGTTLGISVAQNHTSGGSRSAGQDNTTDYMYHNFGGYSGHTRASYYWYDDGVYTNKSYLEVRCYSGGSYPGSLTQVLAIGKYNNVGANTGDTWDSKKYQFRVLYPSASYGWMNCATNTSGGMRSTGWHKFSIERLADGTTINFTVDDVATRTITGTLAADWNTILIGTGSGANPLTAYFDDVLVEYFDKPSITTPPAGQTVTAGGSATFTVVAANNPQSYQWRLNGVNLSGATTSSLTVNNAQADDAGTYTVEVANGVGPATSAAAVLLVAPAITSQPLSRTNLAGATVSFSVAASGQAPLLYRWKKEGVDLANAGNVTGAQSETLTLSGIGQADEGSYTVAITNAGGGVVSAPAVLVVMDPPVISTHPASQAVGAGANVSFTGAATGTAPLSYQWYFNGNPIPGATNPGYTRSGVQAGDSGAYVLTVTNLAGADSSDPATLLVNTAPTLEELPDRVVHAGTLVSFTAAATDPEAPPQTLNFSLEAAPAGAAIDPVSGLFTWLPTATDAGTTNPVTVRVADNGTPPQAATRGFNIIVSDPVTIANAVVTNGTITLTWKAVPGQTYRIQFKDSLEAGDWTDLTDLTAESDTASVVGGLTDDQGPIAQRFYRIQVLTP
jgi:hypothetical protein